MASGQIEQNNSPMTEAQRHYPLTPDYIYNYRLTQVLGWNIYHKGPDTPFFPSIALQFYSPIDLYTLTQPYVSMYVFLCTEGVARA